MPPRLALLLLPAVLLAGCTNPLGSLDTGHCHAEHNQVLATNGTAWSYLKGPPHEGLGVERVYTWGLERTGGCVTDVHLQVHAQLATDTPGCADTHLYAATFVVNATLGGHERQDAVVGPVTHGGTLDWLHEETDAYEEAAQADQPQSWNARMELGVSYEFGAVVGHVDECVRMSVRAMEARGTDRDFKP
jgi:hypothetical protein